MPDPDLPRDVLRDVPRDVPRDIAAQRLERFERHRPAMLRAARDYVAAQSYAEDAVHEAMLRVALYRHIDWTRVEGLLVTATRHVLIDMGRSYRRRGWRERGFGAPVEVDPYEEVEDRLDAHRLVSRLRLAEDDREVLQRVGDGDRVTDIAAADRVAYQTAYSKVSRARLRALRAIDEAVG